MFPSGVAPVTFTSLSLTPGAPSAESSYSPRPRSERPPAQPGSIRRRLSPSAEGGEAGAALAPCLSPASLSQPSLGAGRHGGLRGPFGGSAVCLAHWLGVPRWLQRRTTDRALQRTEVVSHGSGASRGLRGPVGAGAQGRSERRGQAGVLRWNPRGWVTKAARLAGGPGEERRERPGVWHGCEVPPGLGP